jgi:uncharacterized protein YdeI (YjbR/CyaY-like superfamily)
MPKKPAKKAPELEVRRFADAAALRSWLEVNHTSAPGVWIEFAKKGSGIASVTYAEAVELALVFGWIDGQAKSVDERHYRQRFTPRRAKSMWSKINRERAIALIAAGKMAPAGVAEVERAKADGRWDRAYDSPKNATVPEDLASALAKKPKAKLFFEALDSQNRYAILHRLMNAKKAETRAKRIETFVAMLSRGERIHPKD